MTTLRCGVPTCGWTASGTGDYDLDYPIERDHRRTHLAFYCGAAKRSRELRATQRKEDGR